MESAPIEKRDASQPQIEEQKSKLKQIMLSLVNQIKNGCKKDICFSKYCKKNPLGK
jgi:hypothetical protein